MTRDVNYCWENETNEGSLFLILSKGPTNTINHWTNITSLLLKRLLRRQVLICRCVVLEICHFRSCYFNSSTEDDSEFVFARMKALDEGTKGLRNPFCSEGLRNR